MIGFAFASATVTTPWGDTYVDVPATVRNMALTYTLDGEQISVPIIAGWAHGQRGYGVQDAEGREWGIKRTGSGCGC